MNVFEKPSGKSVIEITTAMFRGAFSFAITNFVGSTKDCQKQKADDLRLIIRILFNRSNFALKVSQSHNQIIR